MQFKRLGGLALALSLMGCPSVDYLAPADDSADDDPSADPDGGAGAGDGGTRPVSFARDIRPLMDRADGPTSFGCKRCHYPGEPDPQGLQLGGLDLSTLGALRKGGVSSGSGIVVAGSPDQSAIVQKLEGTYVRGARMPKDRTPWTTEEIGLVRRWIKEGAQGAADE